MRFGAAVLIGCLLGVLVGWNFTARSDGTEVRDLAVVVFRHEKLNLAMQRALFRLNEGQMGAFKILAKVIWGEQPETEAVFSNLRFQFLLLNQQLDQLDEMLQQEMEQFRIADDELSFALEAKALPQQGEKHGTH